MTKLQKTILIFDDDEDILSICAFRLEENGWTVHTSTHCNQVIDQVSAILPDVILMDNWTPDDGGVIATKKLKSTAGLCEIPVIYFSANSDIHLIAAEAGADTYLAKPFDLDELTLKIEAAIGPLRINQG